MDCVAFIQSLHTNRAAVTYIACQERPILFFSLVFTSKRLGLPVVTLDLERHTRADVQAVLAMSFLGQECIYLIVGATPQDTWLEQYTGPHYLYVYTTKHPAAYTLPEQIDATQMLALTNILFPQHKYTWFIQRLSPMSLDAFCLLLMYMPVVGNQAPQFLKQWVPQLVVSKLSLFELSQAFFARQEHEFFTRWAPISTYYAPSFWTVYWSEQLFRASVVVEYQAKQPMLAKKASYRLPFSFINRDWKIHNTKELRNAHDFLYQLDTELKNGIHPSTLDLFFSSFFLHRFTSS